MNYSFDSLSVLLGLTNINIFLYFWDKLSYPVHRKIKVSLVHYLFGHCGILFNSFL